LSKKVDAKIPAEYAEEFDKFADKWQLAQNARYKQGAKKRRKKNKIAARSRRAQRRK